MTVSSSDILHGRLRDIEAAIAALEAERSEINSALETEEIPPITAILPYYGLASGGNKSSST